jgi:hypothetical protein
MSRRESWRDAIATFILSLAAIPTGVARAWLVR